MNLTPLFNFTKEQDIKVLLEEGVSTLEDQVQLWDNRLVDIFMYNGATHSLKLTAQRILEGKKITLIREKASSPALDGLLLRFEWHCKTIVIQSKPMGILPTLIALPQKNELDLEILRKQFSNYTFAKKGDSWKKELLEAYVKLEKLDEIISVVQSLTDEQAMVLSRSAMTDARMAERLPRFLVSLPYSHIEHILSQHRLNLNALNEKLKASPDIQQEWFKKLFIKFRQSVVDACNASKIDIDNFNKALRFIEPAEISRTHLNRIKELEAIIQQHVKTLGALHTLLADIDPEMDHLTVDGLPPAYNSDLRRLSSKFSEISGSPFGIIYRKVFHGFQDYSPSKDVFKLWGIPEEKRPAAIHSVGDMKENEIFNPTLLEEYLCKHAPTLSSPTPPSLLEGVSSAT